MKTTNLTLAHFNAGRLLWLLPLVLPLGRLSACDLCSVYAAMQATGGGSQGFFGGVVEQYVSSGTLQQNGREVPNTIGQFVDSSVSQVFAGYNFNRRLDLELNVPVIYRSFKRPLGAGVESDSIFGLGDISLIGNFVAYQKALKDFTFQWSVLAGVKLPSGDSERLDQPENRSASGVSHGSVALTSVTPLAESGVWGHALALGTGSLDGVVGTSAMARWKRLFINAGVQYAMHTEGDFSYQAANDLTWAGGPGYYLAMKENYTLNLQGLVSGDTRQNDTYSGIQDKHWAETLVYLGPQVNLTWTDKLSVQLAGDLPVSIANSGLQAVPDFRLRAAIRVRF